MLDLALLAVYSGILSGGLYALSSLGLSLVFGTMRIVNLAHGELILLAAYIAFAFEKTLSLPALAALPLSFVVVGSVSMILQLLLGRLNKDREIGSLLLTYGVGIVLTNLILVTRGADVRSTGSDWLSGPAELGVLVSTRGEILSFLASVALTTALWWWLSRSWHGRAVRAASSNPEAAMLMGISPRLVDAMSFAVAAALASVAGLAVYVTSVVQPYLGSALTVKAFIITVLAGVGSVPGVFVAALVLGIAESMTVTFAGSALRELVGLALFLVVLLVSPGGLFGRRARRGG